MMRRLSPGPLECAVSLVGVMTLWVALEPLGWVAALAGHWRAHAACYALGIAVWAGGRRRVRLAVGSLLCVGFLFGPVLPHLQGAQSASSLDAPSGPTLKVLSLNVHMTHREFEPLSALLTIEAPDLVLLVEVDQGWLDGLEPALKEYPYRYQAPREDFLGLAIYSRLPLRGASLEHIGGPDGPMVSAEVQVGDVWIEVALVHGLPPIRSAWVESQRRLFQHLGTPTQGDRPYLLCGDFNAAPWSDGFAEMREGRALGHVRRAGWPGGTWPSWVPAPLRIPIDHCLVSEQWRVKNYGLGDTVGSDHLPLLVELTLQAPPQGP